MANDQAPASRRNPRNVVRKADFPRSLRTLGIIRPVATVLTVRSPDSLRRWCEHALGRRCADRLNTYVHVRFELWCRQRSDTRFSGGLRGAVARRDQPDQQCGADHIDADDREEPAGWRPRVACRYQWAVRAHAVAMKSAVERDETAEHDDTEDSVQQRRGRG